MNQKEKIFRLYETVLRFLPFKISVNLRRIYLDVDYANKRMTLTAYYQNEPSELELELFDDIVTNSNAHIPNLFIEQNYKLFTSFDPNEKHDFIIFAFYD